jgi:hypothetical protein
MHRFLAFVSTIIGIAWFAPNAMAQSHGFQIIHSDERIVIKSDLIEASIVKKGYVSGIEANSFLDKKTCFRDLGYGLDIQDWIMEPGSDAEYRSQLPGDLPYDFGNLFHGNRPKRSIEGPQICTQAKTLDPQVIEGKDFVAVVQSWKYTTAAPGKKTGSEWKQTIVFPKGKRYVITSDRIQSENSGDALFFRQDLPGHIKHQSGDSFSEIYLSYYGTIPSSEFRQDFAPDSKFNYRRETQGPPQRMIRAYHVRDPKSGREGPWLAGLTLRPDDTSEAWCHQRGYVCMIHEVGERPVKEGDAFGAAYVIGWFDSIDEMETVYDQYRDHSGLHVDASGWKLTDPP